MEKQEISKTQIIEAVTMISKRRRSLRPFEEECEMHSWSVPDARELLVGVPQTYQKRYDNIIESARAELEKLSNDMLEDCFSG